MCARYYTNGPRGYLLCPERHHISPGGQWGDPRDPPGSCGSPPGGLCYLVRACLWLSAHLLASQSFLAHQSHHYTLPGSVSEEDKSAEDGMDPGSGGSRRPWGWREGPERQLWSGSMPLHQRGSIGGGGRGRVLTGEAMGSGGAGETMAGMGGGIFHCNRNPVSPGALVALAAPGSSLTALGRPAASGS